MSDVGARYTIAWDRYVTRKIHIGYKDMAERATFTVDEWHGF